MANRIIGIVCTSPGWGGLELNTLRLCKWLREAGWKVHLISAYDSPIARHSADQVNTLSTFGEGPLPKKSQRLKMLHVWKLKYRIPILFLPFNKDISFCSLYKRFYDQNIGLIYQQHMQVGVRKRDFIHTLRYAMIDVWISPLQYLKEETLRLTRVKEERIELIPFGLEPESFKETAWTRELARKELGLAEDAYIIGLLGRLDPKKGQDLVIKALQQLAGRDHYQILLVGSGTLNKGGDAYSQELHDQVINSGLSEKVHFRPYTDDIMVFFRAIDLFAMPAHGETFGMVTLEAMAAGVPVLGTNTDGTKEILGNGKFGHLFERENVESFIQQLEVMRKDPKLPEQVEAARNEAITNYSKEKMVSSIVGVLTEFI